MNSSKKISISISEALIESRFPAFTDQIKNRLKQGAREYGDASFSKDPLTLLNEIQQEVLDICGWSFILSERIEGIKSKIITTKIE